MTDKLLSSKIPSIPIVSSEVVLWVWRPQCLPLIYNAIPELSGKKAL
jgi:hypothetical protein